MLGGPGPAGRYQRNSQPVPCGTQLLQVLTLAHAVLVHAVENDLARAPALGLLDPLKRQPTGITLAVRIVSVLAHTPLAFNRLAVDADDHALAARHRGNVVDQHGAIFAM